MAVLSKFLKILLITLITISTADVAFAKSIDINIFVDAVREGRIEEMHQFIRLNGDVDAVNQHGIPAIYAATVANRPDIIKWLLEQGADIDNPVRNSNVIDPTALLYAGAHGYTECIKVMLAANPDHSIVNRYGGNALIPAAEKGHVGTVKLLLEQSDVDINHINYLGWTALMEAVLLSQAGSEQQEIVELLLTHGADQTIADKNGVTVLQHARTRNLIEVIQMLQGAN